MLSWRAHLFFWALALASLPVAILRERFRHVLPGFLGDTLIENVLPVLAFTAMFSPLRGMRWTYCLCLGCLCVASHDMASGIGFVGRMPSGMAEMDQEGKRMMVAQVLAAFMVLGFLEPLRRNRPEIEMYGAGMLLVWPLRATAQGRLRGKLLALVTFAILDRWVLSNRAWFPADLGKRASYVHAWLLITPLLDVGETLFYTAYNFTHPGWRRARTRLIRKRGWMNWLLLNAALLACWIAWWRMTGILDRLVNSGKAPPAKASFFS